jgi:hypothetical protein
VQAAIENISDAGADNPYLVWVAPGMYTEMVTMKPYVHLQGAGQEATIITSTAGSSAWPPDQATLTLASDTSLRDLTVGNGGTGDRNVALIATAGMTRTLVADVTARVLGGGARNYGVFLIGSGTGVRLQQVTALAENGSYNFGLVNYSGAVAVLHGGSFTARGGTDAYGIHNDGSGTMLEAESVTALAENGSSASSGLLNYASAEATLRGGSFTGRGGMNVTGIYNSGGDATLEAESVTALGEDGNSNNYGLSNSGTGVQATLRGGSFTGRAPSGGTNANGIYNGGNSTTLEAQSVTALGENGSNSNYGLRSSVNATGNVSQSVLEGASDGLYLGTGTVHLAVSQLDGGATNSSGTLTCFQVYDETYTAYTCP